MVGCFAKWQSEYECHGIPTFPVQIVGTRKKPAVRGYLNLGLDYSRLLATRFPESDAFGFGLGRRSNVTVLDIDTSEEAILTAALARHGNTPIIVRSGGGKFQAWYAHNGERRLIRPDRRVPIDILGAGYVVAPPSSGALMRYQFLQGSLDDLQGLPALRNAPGLARPPDDENSASASPLGERNNQLFRYCLAAARGCDDLKALLDAARSRNDTFASPLDDEEVVKTASSAWSYELRGQNYSTGAYFAVRHSEIDELLNTSPDAFLLLALLRRHHWGRNFVVANEMAKSMPTGGWRRERFAAARAVLETSGKIILVRPASRAYGPALFRWPDHQNSRLLKSEQQ